MDLLPPQVDNGLVEPPTGAGALRLTPCECPCWALRQPVKVRAKQRAIIHHPGHIKYVKQQYFIQTRSIASQKHITDMFFRSAFTRYITGSCAYIPSVPSVPCVLAYLLRVGGWNQLSSCLTIVSDASQLFIRSSSASSNVNVSHHGNRPVSPPGGVEFSVFKLDISIIKNNPFRWQKISRAKENFVLKQADEIRA